MIDSQLAPCATPQHWLNLALGIVSGINLTLNSYLAQRRWVRDRELKEGRLEVQQVDVLYPKSPKQN